MKQWPERFWPKVNKTEGCWEWTRAKREGYGVLNVAGKALYAHRLSWELHFGPIPTGMWVLRHCDNRGCVRPDHLFLGTIQDNLADMREKGRGFVPTPLRGAAHPWTGQDRTGEGNPRAFLTWEKVRDIRSRVNAGQRRIDVARAFGISKGHVYSIMSERIWKEQG